MFALDCADFFPLFSKGQMGSSATASSRLCPARKDRAGAGGTAAPEPGTQCVPTATPWLWVLQWHCPSSVASCPLLGPSPGKSKRTFGSCQHSTSARYLILAGGKEQHNLFPIPQGQQQTMECTGTKRGAKKKCRIRDFTIFTILRLLLELLCRVLPSVHQPQSRAHSARHCPSLGGSVPRLSGPAHDWAAQQCSAVCRWHQLQCHCARFAPLPLLSVLLIFA